MQAAAGTPLLETDVPRLVAARDAGGARPLRVRRRRGAALALGGREGLPGLTSGRDAHQRASWCSITPSPLFSARPPGKSAREASRTAGGSCSGSGAGSRRGGARPRTRSRAERRRRRRSPRGRRTRPARARSARRRPRSRARERSRGVVDPVDEVPADGAAVVELADPGGPAPHRVAGVVAGGLVLDASRLELPALVAHADVALDGHAGALARPAVLALGRRADRLDPLAVAEAKPNAHVLGHDVVGQARAGLLAEAGRRAPLPALAPHLAARAGQPQCACARASCRSSRSHTTQKVWPNGPTWTRAAQSRNSSLKTPT